MVDGYQKASIPSLFDQSLPQRIETPGTPDLPYQRAWFATFNWPGGVLRLVTTSREGGDTPLVLARVEHVELPP